jgi:hypothetical protein
MTGRCEADVIKVQAGDADAIYLHVDRWKHTAPTFWVSAPTKFRDSHVGKLIEELMEEVNRALR